jgi:hypothetical protein
MTTNKKLKLYLDDLRTPKEEEWIVVRNYDEFVAEVLRSGIDNFEVVSLDHDLGDTAMEEYFNNVRINYTINYDNIKEKTGLDCAKWLVSHYLEKYNHNDELFFPTVYTHSANPIGAANIIGYINNFFKNIRQQQTCVRVHIPHTINY